LRVPFDGYSFNNTDCWARIRGTVARVGLSDLIRLDPREILAFEPPDVGLLVGIFDRLCALKTDGVSVDLNSPVSGRVTSVNVDLVDDPGLVKEDPYGRGWVAEVELSDIDSDMDFLLDCEEYFFDVKSRLESGPRLGCPCSRRAGASRRATARGRERSQ